MAKRNKYPWDTSNSDHHKLYIDDEIELILTHLPTPNSCVILGKILKRSLCDPANF